MDRWQKSQHEENNRYRHHRRASPSFSSTLLDSIYRSIDEEKENPVLFYRDNSMRKKVNDNVGVRRKSMADIERKPRKDAVFNSTSSSSDSSYGGGFSSSESDMSFYGVSKSRSSKENSTKMGSLRMNQKPQFDSHLFDRYHNVHHQKASVFPQEKQQKHETGFVKTKSKALKFYGDLKKVKQPNSPGAKLANFLNSLFTNAKKAKVSSSSIATNYDDSCSDIKSHTGYASTCSSASSFSRSCLSKTPSKLSTGAKRSVRFCPVSVIVDEDSRPCGEKNLYEEQRSKRDYAVSEELKLHVMEENKRVEEAARELLKKYQKKEENFYGKITQKKDEDDDDEDDAGSCASSDLFELDNLSGIGIERYREELPVYETTHLRTNRAIANGLVL